MGTRQGSVYGNRLRSTMRTLSRSSTRSSGIPFPLEPLKEGHRMDPKERIFLEAAERGDKHTLVRCLQSPDSVNVNCTNIIGRSAIQIAVDNENVEIVELLLKEDGVKIGDALLYAIREGVYRIVEMLIDHPSITPDMLGADWSKYKKEPEDCSDYSPDICPIVLAAHCNQFEILQLLISRGAKIDQPHSLNCMCQRCQNRLQEDSLRHSLLRIHTYRALSSPAWISLTSADPVLTAFKLSWELERLARRENEFADIYCEISEQCKKFACDLLDQCRSSEEVMAVLNKFQDGEDEEEEVEEGKITLARFKLALKYEQKQFVAHPHCQQLLASIWYAGLPGWRKRSVAAKILILIGLILLLPVTSVYYLFFPRSRLGQLLRTPFMKFMYHSASFGVFLFLLILASTNISSEEGSPNLRKMQRGPPPTTLEWLIVFYVMGFIWAECKQLWEEGLKAYVRQWWNWLDFIMLSLYLCTFALRLVALIQSQNEEYYGSNTMSRRAWPENDPTLISEGVFAIANVFSFARIIYLFQANPQLGPLQISLGCMLIDIGKFFFIFFLVITSFACGLNQLYYYYSSTEGPIAGGVENCSYDHCNGSTVAYRQRFSTDEGFDNAFESLDIAIVTLFWTLFGVISLVSLEVHLRIIQGFGQVLFGLYNIAAKILFLNMLIAMMAKSFNVIVDHADREWKFARSKLWMGYFDEGSTVPAPFNLIVSPKSMYYLFNGIKNFLVQCFSRKKKPTSRSRKSSEGTGKLLPLENNNQKVRPMQATGQSISIVNSNSGLSIDPGPPEGLDVDLVIRNVQATGRYESKFEKNSSYQSQQQLHDNPEADSEKYKYQDVMRRLVTRFIHKWKQQMRQDGVNEDDLLEIKQDISSLRYELREDRKRGAHRTATQIESLKREILQSIRHYSGGLNSHVSSAPKNHLEERPISPTMHTSSSGTFLDREDMESLKREIVHSLRSEIRELAKEMITQHNPRASPTNLPSLVPALNSDLYQTHLYTQL